MPQENLSIERRMHNCIQAVTSKQPKGAQFSVRRSAVAAACMLAWVLPSAVCAQSDTTVAPAAAAEKPAQDAQTLERVTISASAQRKLKQSASSGALGSRSVLDTPFSSRVVDNADINERQAQTVDEVFKLDASTKTAANSTVGTNALISVRGLLLDYLNGYKIDGLAYANRVPLPIESFQQAELLKGLTGFMSGFGAPGGLVNYVLKRPTDQPLTNVSVGSSSTGLRKVHLDKGGRLGGEDGRFGYRLNVVDERGNTYVKGGSLERTSASLAVDARITPDLTWTADVLTQDRNTKGVIFATYLPQNSSVAVPKPIKGTTGLAEDGAYYRTNATIASTGLEWTINPQWNATVNYRSSKQRPDFRESNVNVSNSAGDFTMKQSVQKQEFDFNQTQAMVEGKVDTGWLSHQLVFGTSSQRLQTTGDRNAASVTLPTVSNLYAPVPIPASGLSPDNHVLYLQNDYRQVSYFLSDTLHFTPKWSLLMGARRSSYSQDTYSTSGTVTPYSANPISPTVALTFKPNSDTAIYTSYVEGMENAGTAPNTAANYTSFVGTPTKSKQYELGAKMQRNQWSATAALFRIDRGSNYLNPSNVYVQDGIARYQGLELSGSLQPSKYLTLNSNLMLLDANYQQAAASVVGKQVPGAAKLQGALQAIYRLPQLPALKLNASVSYIGKSMLEAGNFHEIPGYTTYDLGASYRTKLNGNQVTLSAAVKNLTDRAYWTTYNSGTPALQQGAPRTLSVMADFSF